MNEKELIESAKQGNKNALSELVKNYEKTVYNFAFKICRSRDKAENTMQETFLSFIKFLNQFDSKSKLSTWLYRIVANHCLMEARKNKRYVFVEPEDDENLFDEKYISDWNSLPIKNLETKELRKILDKAISKLAPEYRIVFILRDVEQFSTEETAKLSELTVPAVKSRLHRARAFLRKEITKAFQK